MTAPLFDLVVASRSFGAGDTGDVQARVTWLKEAGQPKETPKGRVTLADLLPRLEGFTLADTQKTSTEVIRKYRRGGAVMFSSDTEVMTQIKALKLGQLALDHMLTGAPALDTFDVDQLDDAFELLLKHNRARKGKPYSERPIIKSVMQVMAGVKWAQMFGRYSRGGQRRTTLEAVAAALPGIIERLEQAYNDYWQDFAADVLAEAEQIIDEVQHV